MIRMLLRTNRFVRAAKRIVKKNPAIAADLKTTLELLAADAFDPRLRTHKLSGELANSWACSAASHFLVRAARSERSGGARIRGKP